MIEWLGIKANEVEGILSIQSEKKQELKRTEHCHKWGCLGMGFEGPQADVVRGMGKDWGG